MKIFPAYLSEDLDVYKEELMSLIDHLIQLGWVEVERDFTPKGTAYFELFPTKKLHTRAVELRDEARARFEQYRR